MYHKMLRQQALVQKMRPEMQKIQADYKDDREQQTKLLMELYKKYKVNPFYTFLVLLIQLPVLFALFRAFTNGLNGNISGILYSFVGDPGSFNPIFLGIMNLNERNIPLIVLTAVTQFFQARLSSSINKTPADQKMPMPSGNTMGIFLSLFTVFILWNLPAAVGLYWLTTTVFSIGQQLICNKSIKDGESKGDNK
jgi:YidC/Oxa1 family membrane protein insertase